MNIYGIPIECHQHDLVWIQEQLVKLPNKVLLKPTINKYSQVYREKLSEGGLKAVGNARREANTRLLSYVKRQLEAYL